MGQRTLGRQSVVLKIIHRLKQSNRDPAEVEPNQRGGSTKKKTISQNQQQLKQDPSAKSLRMQTEGLLPLGDQGAPEKFRIGFTQTGGGRILGLTQMAVMTTPMRKVKNIRKDQNQEPPGHPANPSWPSMHQFMRRSDHRTTQGGPPQHAECHKICADDPPLP